MTRRKGEVSLGRIKREWPHHVALSAHQVEGRHYGVVQGFANTLSVAPRGYGFRRNDVDYVIFCFAKPDDAEAFASG